MISVEGEQKIEIPFLWLVTTKNVELIRNFQIEYMVYVDDTNGKILKEHLVHSK
jgi:hypothetical protein